MKIVKLSTALFILLSVLFLSAIIIPDAKSRTKEIPPWEKIEASKETVKESSESQVEGFFLVLKDKPKFYNQPGGKLLTKANIKNEFDENSTMVYEDFPMKNETGFAVSYKISNHIKYYKLNIWLNEACSYDLWLKADEGAFLTNAQFSEYTKTLSAMEPQVIEVIASSGVVPLNYASGKKVLMAKSSDSSFYLIHIMQSIVPPRMKKRVDYYGNHQFVIMEKGGVYTLVSPDLKVGNLDSDENIQNNIADDNSPSIKYADLDADGILEIITIRPTIGASAGSDIYGFVGGRYNIIEQCEEGAGCYYTFKNNFIIKHSPGESDGKAVTYNYKSGKLTLVSDIK